MLCDLHPRFNSVTGDRRGEATVTLLSRLCIDFYNTVIYNIFLFVKLFVQLPRRGSTSWPLGTSCLSDLRPLLKKVAAAPADNAVAHMYGDENKHTDTLYSQS